MIMCSLYFFEQCIYISIHIMFPPLNGNVKIFHLDFPPYFPIILGGTEKPQKICIVDADFCLRCTFESLLPRVQRWDPNADTREQVLVKS